MTTQEIRGIFNVTLFFAVIHPLILPFICWLLGAAKKGTCDANNFCVAQLWQKLCIGGKKEHFSKDGEYFLTKYYFIWLFSICCSCVCDPGNDCTQPPVLPVLFRTRRWQFSIEIFTYFSVLTVWNVSLCGTTIILLFKPNLIGGVRLLSWLSHLCHRATLDRRCGASRFTSRSHELEITKT